MAQILKDLSAPGVEFTVDLTRRAHWAVSGTAEIAADGTLHTINLKRFNRCNKKTMINKLFYKNKIEVLFCID